MKITTVVALLLIVLVGCKKDSSVQKLIGKQFAHTTYSNDTFQLWRKDPLISEAKFVSDDYTNSRAISLMHRCSPDSVIVLNISYDIASLSVQSYFAMAENSKGRGKVVNTNGTWEMSDQNYSTGKIIALFSNE